MPVLTMRRDPSGSDAPRGHQRRAAMVRALLVALISAVGLIATDLLFVHTAAGQRLDQAALNHLADGAASRLRVAGWLRYVTVGAVVVVMTGCVVVAFLRKRLDLAIVAFALVAGANLSTQLLKHVILTRPHLGNGWTNSLPSGHATVVTSLVLALMLVAPYAWRWLVSLAGAVAVTVAGVGTVVANWHRPSDVVAAFAVCLAWGALGLAVISARSAPPAARRPARAHPLALMSGLALAAGLFLEVGVRPNGTSRDLVIHIIIMCGLAVIGAVVVGTFARMVNARVA
jgi:membrane-associated phospholipid phosphatase